jgi:hypothetical protein
MDCYKAEDLPVGMHIGCALPTNHCMDSVPAQAAAHNRAARRRRKSADHPTAQPTGVTVVEEPPAPTEALPGARADLKVDVKARKWLTNVAIVCPATKQWPGSTRTSIQECLRRQVKL